MRWVWYRVARITHIHTSSRMYTYILYYTIGTNDL